MQRAPSLLLAVFLALMPVRGWGETEVGDIVFKRATPGSEDVAAAVFPHWVHRIQYKCYACHDALFKMAAGADAISMDAINDGKSCGTCHNGKKAFAPTFSTCTRCHRE